jgi:mono/diheme cytochrome c family protein
MRLRYYGLAAIVSAAVLLMADTKPATAVKKASAPVAKTAPKIVPKKTAELPAYHPPSQAAFEAVTQPLFSDTCEDCHNANLASGGLNLENYYGVGSLEDREQWDMIVQKLQTGEMPPSGIDRPAAKIDALVKFVESEFKKADASVKPDPGRVTARRLNRSEYTNTIRDLFELEFRADKNFPTDDSGDGFDNIGDILTVSPVLMEKYLNAAERIAARAIGADPLPKPIEREYSLRLRNLRRTDASTVEGTHRVDFDAEYKVRIGLPGERAADAKPVTLGFWMDGKLLHSQSVETKPSGLVYFNPYSEAEFSVVLPEGDHEFKVGFIGDDFVKTLPRADLYSDKKNKFINLMSFVGPFPAKGEKPSRKKLLVCDPKTGPLCVEKILSKLAREAYRRPVTKAEVASLTRFVTLARAEKKSVEQGLQLAIQAMLVSPNFLFRIERDLSPTDPDRVHKISNVELASRLSFFLWNSIPDEQLLSLAEAGKLSTPSVLDAQVKRMLADPKSSSMGENFAGQWLEVRNLDSIKPDPQKFPAWGPELRDAMKMETRLFFDSILRENRPISEFINARYTFLNEFLASYYGIEGVTGPEFRKVNLTTEQRGGVLTHGSVLAVSSYPSRTSVVIRGKYILQNILGTPPPPPPPDVPALDDAATGTTASLRQQMEKHRSNSVCASCHSRMDPLGFGLENYDAIGKWRTKDGAFEVDSSGTLPNGKSFKNPAELRQILTAMMPDFSRTITEKMLVYSLGRGLKRYDRATVQDITAKLEASGNGMQDLVLEIVRSLPFQSRRGEAIESAKPAAVAAAAK